MREFFRRLIAPYVLVFVALGLIGAALQPTINEILADHERRISDLEFLALTPSPEFFPDSTPIPFNQVEALNLNSSNVRIRQCAGLSCALTGNVVASQSSVILCLKPVTSANGLKWMRVNTGGWVASDYLQITGNLSTGVACEQ